MSTAYLQPDPVDMATLGPDAGASASAVSWAAIFAGAAAAAALSLILVLLGAGLGFSSVSPWADQGASATALGVSTILWLTLTQLIASGLGGYLAGRLRNRWQRTHVDEVYFRDTAHGFLAWSVATLVTAAVLTSTIGAIAGGGVKAGASVVGGAGSAAVAGGAAAASRSGETTGMSYYVDQLFRKEAAAPASGTDANAAPATGEVTRIFAQSLRTGTLAPEDQQYLAQMVAQRTGLSPDDAGKRVGDLFAKTKAAADEAATKAKQAADAARKTAAYGALWLFISLLIGAFAASLAATFGGRQRDL